MVISIRLSILFPQMAVPWVRIVGLHPNRWRPGRWQYVYRSASRLHTCLNHWNLMKKRIILTFYLKIHIGPIAEPCGRPDLLRLLLSYKYNVFFSDIKLLFVGIAILDRADYANQSFIFITKETENRYICQKRKTIPKIINIMFVPNKYIFRMINQ